ncbi:glucuronosyltransferase [Oryctes borbonicus]|uniref:Glucuronosyltransferase n=1 Tax=Oryctes borbonicus TaxID=1629725 RepID=A0A0T6BDJ5_9SCAR|nr:glucuronosyltransferase [Oryctes borbonicus]
MHYLWLILCAALLKIANSANILFVTVLPSPSHHIWHEVLVKGLLKNGHNITMLSYDEPTFKSTNYTALQLDPYAIFTEGENVNFMKDIGKSFLSEQLEIWRFTVAIAKETLKAERFKQLTEYPKNSFELIIFDMTLSFHFLPLIDHFGKIPAIGTSPYATAPYIGDAFGHHFCTYFPDTSLPYADEMTFLQRVLNTIVYGVAIGVKYYYRTKLDEIVKEKFGENVGSIKEYEDRIGLLLTNYDPILDFPVPVPPQIIPVGGLSAKPSEKLPEVL